ncbi:MAG TPA: hydrogenase iron-sulfur subunit [Anaerolineae bacterium]|nr:hydrogenase iron-sulfur subunit [Anaerolineae bacterium]
MENKAVETFAAQVRAIPGGEHLDLCYSCGTCVSKCMIQDKVEPDFNPRRLLHMVMMGMREEAFKSPTTWMCSECDLCYTACPQEIHISSVIAAVKQLAIEAGYESPLETVEVNEDLCSGCAICVMVCPYEAPHLIEKEVNGVLDWFSEVDENKCMGCGHCVAACPSGAIARKGVANEDIVPQINIKKPKKKIPSLLVFVCDWCLRVVEDVEILESYPENVRVIHIPCTGRIDPQMALMALSSGIDGVLVCGCAPGECHYKRGNYVSSCKLNLLGKMMDKMELADGRVRFVQIGTQDRGRIRLEMDNMLETLALLKEVA